MCVSQALVHASAASLTVVDEVLDDLLASRQHGVMQQRSASVVLQQHVRPLLVELHQLHINNNKNNINTGQRVGQQTWRCGGREERTGGSVKDTMV